MSDRELVLSPSSMQLLASSGGIILFLIVGIVLAGTGNKNLMMVGVILSLGCFLVLLGRLWHLSSVKWSITETQIKYIRGIVNRTTDYMELYRVIDYQERQGLVQQMFGLRDIIIIAGDKSHSILIMYGIKQQGKINVIDFINKRVEQSKEKRNIYEITNR